LAARSGALSAERWAAGRAHWLAQQLAPRPVLSSLQKRKHGLADIIGGAAPAITAIRTVPGRRQWARVIVATELIGFADSAKSLPQVAAAFINPARFSQVALPWMNCDRTVMRGRQTFGVGGA